MVAPPCKSPRPALPTPQPGSASWHRRRPTPFHQTEIFLLARLGSPDRGLSLWTPRPSSPTRQGRRSLAPRILKSELGIPIVDS